MYQQEHRLSPATPVFRRFDVWYAAYIPVSFPDKSSQADALFWVFSIVQRKDIPFEGNAFFTLSTGQTPSVPSSCCTGSWTTTVPPQFQLQ